MAQSDPTHQPVTDEQYDVMRRRISAHFDEMRQLMDEAIQADLEAMEQEDDDAETE
ncbi:hypothetical protein SAMN04488691_1177 [Haloferax larsenii]|uniref:Uncharacterized protein n=1 Tax=Haloferax larsenii TaxID=302484 RepID=A0A1H7V4L6_HALLR|nr:hypothetical protein SAMN04488691_1177 [Haloferax larsenii]